MENESKPPQQAESTQAADGKPTLHDDPDDVIITKLISAMKVAGMVEKTEDRKPLLPSLDVEGIAKFIIEHDCRNIIVMAGAGISTAAGIPDFRTPGTGLYDNLQKYNLPRPTAVFELDYFRDDPEPFFKLAKGLYPDNFKPTLSHCFVKILEDQGRLLRHFTQNIDMLERKAGVSPHLLVEAHGSFASSHCISCHKEASNEEVRAAIDQGTIPKCVACNGLVKPDIVFFGESLPDRFGECVRSDFPKCDLLIVMGTSLAVQPFASLVNRVGKNVPRLLINRDKVGEANPILVKLGFADGLNFSSGQDVACLGLCDDGVVELARALGVEEALRTLHAKLHASA